MARAHCTVFSLLAASNNPTRIRPLILLSSNPSSRPSKATHRKNYLRPKILKIIKRKPYPPTLPPQEPSPPPPSPQPADVIIFPESPEEEDLIGVEIPAGETYSEDVPASPATEEADKLEELQFSEVTVEHKGISGKVSATTIFKFGGVCLIGGFVYQMICTVLFVVNYSSREKGGNLEVNGRQKRDFLFNGNNGNNGNSAPVDDAGNVFAVMSQILMEKKIEEIKLMAREARRFEGKKKEEEDGDDYGSDDDLSAVSSPRLGIEREISSRLMKLQNKINSIKDSSAALQINSSGNSAKSIGGVTRDGNKNVNQGNEPLMIKKKHKFKSPSTKETKTPKGFARTRVSKASYPKMRSSEGRGTALSDATDRAQISNEDKKVHKLDIETQESISSVPLKERGESVYDESKEILYNGKNLEGKIEAPEAGDKTKKLNKGGVQETSPGVSAVNVKSSESRKLRTQKSQGFMDENQDSDPVFEKDVVQSFNGSSRHGLAIKKSAANRVRVKQANTKTDMWWLNLRYVLVILMQRGSNGGAKGLYSIKYTSEEQDQSNDSYTVAFEDQADANNFCFLLESFFQDLGDFAADVVPMSIQEVKEDIISHGKKVVVVKKRQLQLFAGQPLADVEKALCSLIEQD